MTFDHADTSGSKLALKLSALKLSALLKQQSRAADPRSVHSIQPRLAVVKEGSQPKPQPSVADAEGMLLSSTPPTGSALAVAISVIAENLVLRLAKKDFLKLMGPRDLDLMAAIEAYDYPKGAQVEATIIEAKGVGRRQLTNLLADRVNAFKQAKEEREQAAERAEKMKNGIIYTAGEAFLIDPVRRCMAENTDNGALLLTNFTALLEEEVEYRDRMASGKPVIVDGASTSSPRILYHAKLTTFDGQIYRRAILSDDFITGNWPLHVSSVCQTVPGLEKKARQCIQAYSQAYHGGTTPRKIVYGRTGWIKHDGRDVYAYQDGGIGPDGFVTDLSCNVADMNLGGYRLDLPADNVEARLAVREVLGLLDLAPAHVMAPMLCCAFRGPLGETPLTVWVVGSSGSYKTQVAALIQQLYGAGMDSDTLPASWTDTNAGLEQAQWCARDALLLIDDFAPKGDSKTINELHNKAEAVLRRQGNLQGKRRYSFMEADTINTNYKPSGILLSTGEDLPKNFSALARTLFTRLAPNSVKLDELTRYQGLASRGVLAKAMGCYIQWLAARPDERDEAALDRRFIVYRDAASKLGLGGHGRMTSNMAELACGMGSWLRFALDRRFITQEEYDTYADRIWSALYEASRTQADSQQGDNPLKNLLDAARSALREVVNSKAAHVAMRGGGRPGGVFHEDGSEINEYEVWN
jgi:hypothetical protein